MNKVGKEWVSTYSGEVKPTTFLISQSGLSVMEVQHSKLTRFLSWVYTCPFFPMNSVFPERVSFLTAHHPTSQDYAWLFHTDKHWREMMRRQRPGKSEREGERERGRERGRACSDIDPFVFILGKKMGLAYKNGWFFYLLGLIQLGWNLFRTLSILAELQGEVQCGQKQTLEYKYNIPLRVWPGPVSQCFILNHMQ